MRRAICWFVSPVATPSRTARSISNCVDSSSRWNQVLIVAPCTSDDSAMLVSTAAVGRAASMAMVVSVLAAHVASISASSDRSGAGMLTTSRSSRMA